MYICNTIFYRTNYLMMDFRYIAISFLFIVFGFNSTSANDVVIDDDKAECHYIDVSEGEDEVGPLFKVTGADIIEKAMKYLGRPYRYGKKGPNAFDCSGFTSYIYGTKNISLSPSSKMQYTQGVSVRRGDLRQGDLVFFTSPHSGRGVGHVGIVTEVEEDGNFLFVHASRRGVVVDNYAKAGYYKNRYIGARRILNH